MGEPNVTVSPGGMGRPDYQQVDMLPYTRAPPKTVSTDQMVPQDNVNKYAPRSTMGVINMLQHIYYFQKISWWRQTILAVEGGALLAIGAWLHIAYGSLPIFGTPATAMLVQGLCISAGFLFAYIVGGLLFTEVMAHLPISFALNLKNVLQLLRFWLITIVCNIGGMFLTASIVLGADVLEAGDRTALSAFLKSLYEEYENEEMDGVWKMLALGTVGGMILGLSSYFVTMSYTILDKVFAVAIPISVAYLIRAQLCPINLAFMVIGLVYGEDDVDFEYSDALNWNIFPVFLGNILGGLLIVAIPLRFAHGAFMKRRYETTVKQATEEP